MPHGVPSGAAETATHFAWFLVQEFAAASASIQRGGDGALLVRIARRDRAMTLLVTRHCDIQARRRLVGLAGAVSRSRSRASRSSKPCGRPDTTPSSLGRTHPNNCHCRQGACRPRGRYRQHRAKGVAACETNEYRGGERAQLQLSGHERLVSRAISPGWFARRSGTSASRSRRPNRQTRPRQGLLRRDERARADERRDNEKTSRRPAQARKQTREGDLAPHDRFWR